MPGIVSSASTAAGARHKSYNDMGATTRPPVNHPKGNFDIYEHILVRYESLYDSYNPRHTGAIMPLWETGSGKTKSSLARRKHSPWQDFTNFSTGSYRNERIGTRV